MLGTHYRGWMKASYHLNDNEFIWMVAIDGEVHYGWRDSWQDGKIIERYVGHAEPSNLYEGIKTERRLVFEKCDNGRGKYFVFRGVYQLEEGPSERYRVLRLVSKEYVF